jgi:hypothetical protein
MTDVNLLVFGCVVSFIVVAGAYVYFRECITAEERPGKPEARPADVEQGKLRDVA